MTYTLFCEDDKTTFKRIAAALEGIESRMALIAPAKAVEYGPETVEAVQKLLNDISDDIEEELKVPRESMRMDQAGRLPRAGEPVHDRRRRFHGGVPQGTQQDG